MHQTLNCNVVHNLISSEAKKKESHNDPLGNKHWYGKSISKLDISSIKKSKHLLPNSGSLSRRDECDHKQDRSRIKGMQDIRDFVSLQRVC